MEEASDVELVPEDLSLKFNKSAGVEAMLCFDEGGDVSAQDRLISSSCKLPLSPCLEDGATQTDFDMENLSFDVLSDSSVPHRKRKWNQSGEEAKVPLENTDSGSIDRKRRCSNVPEIALKTKLQKSDTRVKKFKRPGFDPSLFYETRPYTEDGFRKVYPYFFTFTAFCKARWKGKRLLDMFEQEFRRYPREYYEKQIARGRVLVNYEATTADCILNDNDLVSNTIHRHEFPVLNSPVTIVHDDEAVVVVDKPPSLPVHPCGRYRHNSLTWILVHEMKYPNLHVIHRLDRLTSGLVLLGKTLPVAQKLEAQIRDRMVSKEYFCIVDGEFPDEEVVCDEPIAVISHKIGVCGVRQDGKPSSTSFERLHVFSENGEHPRSLLLCRPRTGRMHQIRVHLQYLGFPIVGDSLYNSVAFGPNKGKGGEYGKSCEEVIADLISIHNKEAYVVSKDDKGSSEDQKQLIPVDSTNTSPALRDGSPVVHSGESESSTPGVHVGAIEEAIDQPRKPVIPTTFSRGCQTGQEKTSQLEAFDPDFTTFDDTCLECNVSFRDPTPEECFMYLHAYKYKADGWEYKTGIPEWVLIAKDKIT